MASYFGLTGHSKYTAVARAVQQELGVDPRQYLGLVKDDGDFCPMSEFAKTYFNMSTKGFNKLLERLGILKHYYNESNRKCWVPTDEYMNYFRTDKGVEVGDNRNARPLLIDRSILPIVMELLNKGDQDE